MKSMLCVGLAVMVIAICVVDAQSTPYCDSPDITQAVCDDYTNQGAIYVSFEGKTEGLTDAEIESFQIAIANASSEYVLLVVQPTDVMIVERGSDGTTGDRTLRFFVLNPSRSMYMPVAFRSQELYLLVKLNNDVINEISGLTVRAQAPPSAYPLVIPAWGIAILGYAALVIIIYCVMVMTRDWRKKKQAEYEADLEKRYYENDPNKQEYMTMKGIDNANNYEIVNELPKKNMVTIGVQTPRHVAVQVDPGDVLKYVAAANTIQVVIENGPAASSSAAPPHDNVFSAPPAEKPPQPPSEKPPQPPSEAESLTHSADSTETPDIVPLSSAGEMDVGNDEASVAAAIEGAINEGFAEDEDGATPVISTSL